MGVDLGTVGEGFSSLFQGIVSLSWPTEFFRKGLGIEEDTVLSIIPGFLLACLAVYLISLVSCLTMRAFQKKKSIFGWREKLTNFILTLLPFLTFRLLLGTCQAIGETAAGVNGAPGFSLEGLSYLWNLFLAVGWWRIVLMLLFAGTLVYPLTKVRKCVLSYEPIGVAILWTVFDLGLGLACMASLLLGMYCGSWLLYALGVLLIVLNWCGEKLEPFRRKKKREKQG